MGSNHYCEKVDMWSVGCVFAELVLRVPLFPGQGKDEEATRLNQLSLVARLLGSPDPKVWKVGSSPLCLLLLRDGRKRC